MRGVCSRFSKRICGTACPWFLFFSCWMSVFYLVSMQALTSLPPELWFGWGGKWGLLWCWRAPRGCSPLNCFIAAPCWWRPSNPGTNNFYHCVLCLWSNTQLSEPGAVPQVVGSIPPSGLVLCTSEYFMESNKLYPAVTRETSYQYYLH